MNENEIINQINGELDKAINDGDLEGVCKTLEYLHMSDAHGFIKAIESKRVFNKILQKMKVEDIKLYQRYQDIRQRARLSYQHDMKCPTNREVDHAISVAYKICINLVGILNQTLIEQGEAINRIEEKLGIEQTPFNYIKEGDNAIVTEDVQGNKDTARNDGQPSEQQ